MISINNLDKNLKRIKTDRKQDLIYKFHISHLLTSPNSFIPETWVRKPNNNP